MARFSQAGDRQLLDKIIRKKQNFGRWSGFAPIAIRMSGFRNSLGVKGLELVLPTSLIVSCSPVEGMEEFQ